MKYNNGAIVIVFNGEKYQLCRRVKQYDGECSPTGEACVHMIMIGINSDLLELICLKYFC